MMPGAWQWYATIEGDTDEYGFESDTRGEAIRAILPDVGPNQRIVVCEARMSSAAKYEGADFVPFTAMRNVEVLDHLGMALGAAAKS